MITKQKEQITVFGKEMDSIAKKLDLEEYLDSFISFMSRPKSPAMEGDTSIHYRFIDAIQKSEFPPPPKIPECSDMLLRLDKQGVLRLDEIFVFIKITAYFNRLKTIEFSGPVSEWLSDIVIPEEIASISDYFTEEGDINPQKEPELLSISNALNSNRSVIRDTLRKLTHSQSLKDYLVDTQIHLQNGEETLLVRGGFSAALKASVIGRSTGGFFYILPDSTRKLKEKEAELLSRREKIIWEYCRDFSATMHKWRKFLRFIDKEFDRFDHYQARVLFARSRDYEIVLPDNSNRVILDEFSHPALEKPVAVSIGLEKPVMLITGVNAGGKTMLLKSLLASVFMAKYLLPFRCNTKKTKIGRFRHIEAIIDDPQSVKNDISTFAGRMLEFSRLFRMKNAIVGVDEIELGTDSDEAASLFRVILEELSGRDIIFVVTTHHKRLASLMAGDDSVELVAALYDEKKRKPTYTFLQGSIGKSYAFETAERYGIPASIVERAKKLYGEDKEKLNELIERSTILENEMRKKTAEAESKLEKISIKEHKLEEMKKKLQEEQRKVLATLENRYNAATKRALAALKEAESAEARRLLNEAHGHKQRVKLKNSETKKAIEFKKGDIVKYRGQRGEILTIRGKNATISIEGMKVRVSTGELESASEKTQKTIKKRVDIRVEKSDRASVSIKLLGFRSDDAIDELDRFLSDALLHGLNEIEIIHGTGTGILAKTISEYLKKHPKVKNFYRMPGNMGVTVAEL